MAKILLVEDDENLREIYQARLMAEGYEIVSAKDGEEALVVAKQEKPDLIIADIMMPRISGFEMLDILRNTEDMKHVKVIMLTALGQAEDKQRADKLGADRYLVKSQVTLEDIVHAAAELLGDQAAKPVQEALAPTPVTPAAATPTPSPAVTTTVPTTSPVATPSTPQPQQAAQPLPVPTIPTATPPAATPVQPAPQSIPTPPAPLQTQPAPQPQTPPVGTASAPIPTPSAGTDASGSNATSRQPSSPSAPPVPSTTTNSQQTTSPTQPTGNQQTPSTTAVLPNPSKEINNASQLADAVNNLINGTSDQPTPTPQRGSVPHATNRASVVAPEQPTLRPLQPQTPVANKPASSIPSSPRAFPTGAPTIAPEPPKSAGPVVKPPEPLEPPKPEPNITKPQGPQPSQAEPQIETPDSIAIKDKKTVEPLKFGGSATTSDLNDLLKKEDSQSQMPGGVQMNNPHQPGQVFTPGGSAPTDDPSKISL